MCIFLYKKKAIWYNLKKPAKPKEPVVEVPEKNLPCGLLVLIQGVKIKWFLLTY